MNIVIEFFKFLMELPETLIEPIDFLPDFAKDDSKFFVNL